MTTTLEARGVRLGYGKKIIADNMSVSFQKPEIVSIIGPNGSGKSTLLKALGRLLAPQGGAVYLNGEDMAKAKTGEIARLLSVLPQSASAPPDLTVWELAACGRLPYRSALSDMGRGDKEAIERALGEVGLLALKDRTLGAISGGERQRAWISMALAQEPRVLLLDEPTTYLDIHYQLELMELVRRLNEKLGLTIIMVMHDLNYAAAYSHRLIAVKHGEILADGTVAEVFNEELLAGLYEVKIKILEIAPHGEKQLLCCPYS